MKQMKNSKGQFMKKEEGLHNEKLSISEQVDIFLKDYAYEINDKREIKVGINNIALDCFLSRPEVEKEIFSRGYTIENKKNCYFRIWKPKEVEKSKIKFKVGDKVVMSSLLNGNYIILCIDGNMIWLKNLVTNAYTTSTLNNALMRHVEVIPKYKVNDLILVKKLEYRQGTFESCIWKITKVEVKSSENIVYWLFDSVCGAKLVISEIEFGRKESDIIKKVGVSK